MSIFDLPPAPACSFCDQSKDLFLVQSEETGARICSVCLVMAAGVIVDDIGNARREKSGATVVGASWQSAIVALILNDGAVK
jgi:hypothetical protein